jgi:alpha-amylase
MDVNTEHPDVISQLQAWIPEYVKEFGIDGIRIDAAKHVRGDFWTGFCGASGVFCIGEVYGDDMQFAADWQREGWMDAILGFPLYYGITAGFGTPMGNMSHFIDVAGSVLQNFPVRPMIVLLRKQLTISTPSTLATLSRTMIFPDSETPRSTLNSLTTP